MLKAPPFDAFDPRILMCPLHCKSLMALATDPRAERKLLCFQCLKSQEIAYEDISYILNPKTIEKALKIYDQSIKDQLEGTGSATSYTSTHLEAIIENTIVNLRYYKEFIKTNTIKSVEKQLGLSNFAGTHVIRKKMLGILQKVANARQMDEMQAHEYICLYSRLVDVGKHADSILKDLRRQNDTITIKMEQILTEMDAALRKVIGIEGHSFSLKKTDLENNDNKLPLINPQNRQCAVSLKPEEGHQYSLESIKFLEYIPGANRAVFCTDHDLHLVDTQSFDLLKSFERAHSNVITGLRYFDKRGTLFTSSADYKLRSWKIDRDITPRQTFELPGAINSFDMIDRSRVAVGGEFPAIYILDAMTKDRQAYAIAPYFVVLCLRYLPWRDSIVFSAEKGAVAIYDLKAKGIVCRLKGYANYQKVGILEVDIKRKLLYSINTDKHAKLFIWDLEDDPEEAADSFELKNYVVGQLIHNMGLYTLAMSVKKHPFDTSKAMILLINKKPDDGGEEEPEVFIQELAVEETPMQMMPLAYMPDRDIVLAGCNRAWEENIAIKTVRVENHEEVMKN